MSAQRGKNQNLGLRKRRKKPGDLGQLRRVLWGALLEVEAILETGDTDKKLRAAHALGTLAGSYLKATETSDLEKQLQDLRVRIDELSNAQKRTSPARDDRQELGGLPKN